MKVLGGTLLSKNNTEPHQNTLEQLTSREQAERNLTIAARQEVTNKLQSSDEGSRSYILSPLTKTRFKRTTVELPPSASTGTLHAMCEAARNGPIFALPLESGDDSAEESITGRPIAAAYKNERVEVKPA